MEFDNFKEYIINTPDGMSINYGLNFTPEEVNDKPVVVFNYGLVCNIAHWKYQIPFFSSIGFNVVYHDYRFHFKSGSTEFIQDLTFSNISKDMKYLLDFLGVKSAYHIGHSMGVNITLEYAKDYPEDVIGMVLISGTVLPPQDILFDSNWMEILQPILETLNQKYPTLYKNIWKTGHLNPLAKHLIHKGGFNTKRVPREFIEYYLLKIGELSPEVFFQLLKEMKNHKIISQLEYISTPTLVMGGDKDQVIPNFLQNILSDSLPNSRLYIIKDGSHVPQVDFHATVNERIRIFLDNHKALNT
ncbi:MAG: alpha/beta hydrolase [Bacteriovoracaceae bacterium]|nr:alpha/beta hydrolase [Bacteriovoracaceae bacterium]